MRLIQILLSAILILLMMNEANAAVRPRILEKFVNFCTAKLSGAIKTTDPELQGVKWVEVNDRLSELEHEKVRLGYKLTFEGPVIYSEETRDADYVPTRNDYAEENGIQKIEPSDVRFQSAMNRYFLATSFQIDELSTPKQPGIFTANYEEGQLVVTAKLDPVFRGRLQEGKDVFNIEVKESPDKNIIVSFSHIPALNLSWTHFSHLKIVPDVETLTEPFTYIRLLKRGMIAVNLGGNYFHDIFIHSYGMQFLAGEPIWKEFETAVDQLEEIYDSGELKKNPSLQNYFTTMVNNFAGALELASARMTNGHLKYAPDKESAVRSFEEAIQKFRYVYQKAEIIRHPITEK